MLRVEYIFALRSCEIFREIAREKVNALVSSVSPKGSLIKAGNALGYHTHYRISAPQITVADPPSGFWRSSLHKYSLRSNSTNPAAVCDINIALSHLEPCVEIPAVLTVRWRQICAQPHESKKQTLDAIRTCSGNQWGAPGALIRRKCKTLCGQ